MNFSFLVVYFYYFYELSASYEILQINAITLLVRS